MKFITVGLLLVIAGLCLVESCDVQVKIVSHTTKEVKFQIIVPSLKMKTEQFELLKYGDKRLVKVNGRVCAGDRWLFKMWQKTDNGWKLVQEDKKRLDGNGWVQIEINDIPRFFFHGAYGVISSGY